MYLHFENTRPRQVYALTIIGKYGQDRPSTWPNWKE